MQIKVIAIFYVTSIIIKKKPVKAENFKCTHTGNKSSQRLYTYTVTVSSEFRNLKHLMLWHILLTKS